MDRLKKAFTTILFVVGVSLSPLGADFGFVETAKADFVPPPPPPKPKVASADTSNHGGNWVDVDKTVAGGVGCVALNEGLDAAASLPPPKLGRRLVRSGICGVVVAAVPVAGVGGGLVGAVLAPQPCQDYNTGPRILPADAGAGPPIHL